VLIHNLPTTQTLQLTLTQAAQIYAGNITNWNDSALKPNNPGFPFPNAAIIPVVRIDYTTTTSVFTFALSNYSETWSHDYGQFADPQISVVNKSVSIDLSNLKQPRQPTQTKQPINLCFYSFFMQKVPFYMQNLKNMKFCTFCFSNGTSIGQQI